MSCSCSEAHLLKNKFTKRHSCFECTSSTKYCFGKFCVLIELYWELLVWLGWKHWFGVSSNTFEVSETYKSVAFLTEWLEIRWNYGHEVSPVVLQSSFRERRNSYRDSIAWRIVWFSLLYYPPSIIVWIDKITPGLFQSEESQLSVSLNVRDAPVLWSSLCTVLNSLQ